MSVCALKRSVGKGHRGRKTLFLWELRSVRGRLSRRQTPWIELCPNTESLNSLNLFLPCSARITHQFPTYLYSPIKSRWVSDPWSPPAVGWARCHDWARSSIGGARRRGRRGMATDGRVHTSGPQTITNPNRRKPNCSSAATVNIHSIQLLRW